MSSPISTILANLRRTVNILRSAVYAIDVRDDIADAIDDSADAIEQIYGDVNSPTLREEGFAAALQEAIDNHQLPIPATVIDDNSLPGSKIQQGSLPLDRLAEPVQITVDSALSDSSTNPVQNKVVKGALDELNGSIVTEVTRNMFDKKAAKIGKISRGGNPVSNANGDYTSDYMPVVEGHTYTYRGFDRYYGCIYHTDKTPVPVSVQVLVTGGDRIVPKQDGYIRLCLPAANLDIAQFEESETATEYTPHESLVDYTGRYLIAKNTEKITQNTADIAKNTEDIEELKENGLIISESVIEEKVNTWLDENPDATSTVQDGSVTRAKMAINGQLVTDYVCPEDFGAVGDGVTDDTDSIQAAIDFCLTYGKRLVFSPKTYATYPRGDDRTAYSHVGKNYCLLVKNGHIDIDLNGATITTLQNTVYVRFIVILCIICDGVSIKNGTIVGDRDTFDYENRGGQWDGSKALEIFDCRNVVIENVIMKKTKGDILGINGVEYGQNVNYPFEDYYMNIHIRNCIMSEGYRNGIVVSRARGVTIENCLIEKTHGTAPEAGVDIEPYYGENNVFDITFKGCRFRENAAADMYNQNCHMIEVINCQGDNQISARHTKHMTIIDSKFSNFTYNGSGGKIVNSTFTGKIDVNGIPNAGAIKAGTAYSWNDISNIIVEKSVLNGNIAISGGTASLKDIIIRDNVIQSKNPPISSVADDGMFTGITIEHNTIINESVAGTNSQQGIARINNIPDVYINDNRLIVESTGLRGSVIGAFNACDNVFVKGNVVEYKKDSEKVYTHNPYAIIEMNEGRLYVEGNCLNLDGVEPSTREEFYVVRTTQSENDIAAFIMGNYLYGVTKTKDGNSVKILTDVRNSYFLKPSSIMSGYKISNNVAVAEETAEIAIYAVTEGEELYLYLPADFEECTYRWQSSATVSDSSSSNVVGTPVTGDVEGKVTVPSGATHLAVSRLINNTFSKVERRN